MGGDQHVVAADRGAGRFELGAQLTVGGIGGRLEWLNVDG